MFNFFKLFRIGWQYKTNGGVTISYHTNDKIISNKVNPICSFFLGLVNWKWWIIVWVLKRNLTARKEWSAIHVFDPTFKIQKLLHCFDDGLEIIFNWATEEDLWETLVWIPLDIFQTVRYWERALQFLCAGYLSCWQDRQDTVQTFQASNNFNLNMEVVNAVEYLDVLELVDKVPVGGVGLTSKAQTCAGSQCI